MAHQIETFKDGTAAFAEAPSRKQAWHRLGTVTEGAMTAEEALSLASLSGWNVRKISLTGTEITDSGASILEIPGHYATVRSNPKTGETEPLGVVGSKYTPVQNEENCTFINTMLDVSGAVYDTAGSLKGGRRVFVTMKLPGGIRIAGVDDIDLYIAATNSHDGSSAFTIMVTPIRVVCQNTLDWALAGARRKISFSHTPGAKDRISRARSALGILHNHCEVFEQDAERLINEQMAMDELKAICDRLWPIDDEPTVRSKNIHDKRLTTIEELFENAETQSNIRGTRWAGIQAIGEYVDHFAPAANADVRATRVLIGSAEELKQKAHAFITAL